MRVQLKMLNRRHRLGGGPLVFALIPAGSYLTLRSGLAIPDLIGLIGLSTVVVQLRRQFWKK